MILKRDSFPAILAVFSSSLYLVLNFYSKYNCIYYAINLCNYGPCIFYFKYAFLFYLS